MTDLILASQEATMTSLEIAELVESRHDSVKRTIERLAEGSIIPQPPTVDGEKSGNNSIVKLYLVDKRSSYIIVAQLSPEFTARLVDRWQELESMVPVPKELTRLELIKMALDSEEQRIESEKRAIKAESTVAILTHVNKNYSATEIAKELGFRSAIVLNKELQDRKIQFKSGGTWVLYSKYAELGYTDIKQSTLDNGHVIYDRRWTGMGREFLISLFETALEVI